MISDTLDAEIFHIKILLLYLYTSFSMYSCPFNLIAGSNEINFLFRISCHQLKIKKKIVSAPFIAVMSETSGEPDIP
jgi:hypothetical protein